MIKLSVIRHKRLKLCIVLLFLCVYAVRCFLGIPCLFLYFTKIPCPACGITRAWLAFFKGDFGEAFAFHPLFWSVPVLLIYAVFDGNVFGRRAVNRGIIIGITVMFAAYFFLGLLFPETREMIYIK